MEYSNKQVIDALQKYYMEKSDFKTVARALAACMVDFNRLCYSDHIPQKERDSLFYRIKENVEQIRKFIKNGLKDDKEFKCINLSEEDE